MRDETVMQELLQHLEEGISWKLASSAFPAEMAQEEALENEGDYFDAIVDDDDIGHDEDELLIQEREMLEEMPLPGRSESEAERIKNG